LLNSKKEKLKSLSTEKENKTTTNSLTALEMPALLSSITTGLDIHQIELNKLVDAPQEWNFYSHLSNSKMLELVESIKDIGLMHPIVVWEQNDGNYMILSGHNRKKAYSIILESMVDSPNEEIDKYKKIHCYVKKFEDLTVDEAKEIIIDTNWVQRELSPVEKAKSIFEKYTNLKSNRAQSKNKLQRGKTRDLIAKQFDISGRQVADYYRLNYLIKEFKELLRNNSISIKAGVKLAQFSTQDQNFIYKNYKDILDNKMILKLEPSFSHEDIDDMFESFLEDMRQDMVKLSYKLMVPLDLQDSFQKDFNKIISKYGITYSNY
jgi:ParB family chromosome partitioning protein